LKLGEKFAKQHKILLLNGELGAGKTLLTKWFIKWLGMDENQVQSPTYAYLNIYDDKVLHMDMYRLETFEELIEKWIIDQLLNHEFIIIERPKFIDQLPIKDFVVIDIEKLNDHERHVHVK
jgi:tRNA threonylcarbamoyladenosine biosynthesis protein TsaE